MLNASAAKRHMKDKHGIDVEAAEQSTVKKKIQQDIVSSMSNQTMQKQQLDETRTQEALRKAASLCGRAPW